MTVPLSPYGITKAEHDAITATRNRPYTDEWDITTRTETAPDGGDHIDELLSRIGPDQLARFTARRKARQEGAHHT